MPQVRIIATQLQAISKAATQSLQHSSSLSQDEITIMDNAKMAERYLKVRSMAAMDLEHISVNSETASGFDALIDKMPSTQKGHMRNTTKEN